MSQCHCHPHHAPAHPHHTRTAPLGLLYTAWPAEAEGMATGTACDVDADAAAPAGGSRRLSGRLAASFNAAVYTTVLSMKVGDEGSACMQLAPGRELLCRCVHNCAVHEVG